MNWSCKASLQARTGTGAWFKRTTLSKLHLQSVSRVLQDLWSFRSWIWLCIWSVTRFLTYLNCRFIFNFCTQTGPYLSPLYDHMKQNGIVMNISLPKEELKISDIFSALDNAKFIKEIPAVSFVTFTNLCSFWIIGKRLRTFKWSKPPS